MLEGLGGSDLPEAARRKIVETAEGNPLFLEQLLAHASEAAAGDGELSIPPTIQALLAARLDALEPQERDTLERAAVVGQRFSLAAVAALLPAATGRSPATPDPRARAQGAPAPRSTPRVG